MGDWERVFSELVAARGAALLRHGYLLTGGTGDAADLVQEALVRTFSRASRNLTVESAEAYVRRAMVTILIDGWRRRRRWRAVSHLFALDRTVEDGPESAFLARDEVRDALAVLSPRQRACVVLRYYDDLPLSHIADQLGCGVGTVKRHLSDALARMEPHLTNAVEGQL